MRNKLKLSPKTKTTVSVKRTLVYASVGAGIFVMLFTGAFFYLNMGNSEEALAAGVITANSTGGSWEINSTWDLNREIADGDEIIIPANVTVTINTNVRNLSGVTIKVFGTLVFDKGKLILDDQSTILIAESGDMITDEKGSNEQLQIGNRKWSGSQIDAISSPSQVTKDGEFSNDLLPIVLDYFTAEVTPTNSVLVKWGTVSEKENDFFTLERSSDGKTFEKIANIEGAGNSLQKLQYSFEDKKSTVGMNYYRLKQTDYNGDFEYFKIAGVNNTVSSSHGAVGSQKEAMVIGEAYPNPFKSEVNLTFESETDGNVEIIIQNSRGEIVHKEIVPSYYGTNDYKFSKGDQLQPGIYYINLWSNGKKFKPQRLIKM